MVTSRQVRELMASAPTFNFLLGEVKEFGSEVIKFSPSGMKDEGQDVMFFIHALLWEKLRINIPALGAGLAVQKTLRRHKIWEEIFRAAGISLNPIPYLSEGSNCSRVFKRLRVLESAWKDYYGVKMTSNNFQAVEKILREKGIL